MSIVFQFAPGIPGGIEMIIVLFVWLLAFVVPLVAVAGIVVYLYRRAGSSDNGDAENERIAELEREVAELRERVEDRD